MCLSLFLLQFSSLVYLCRSVVAVVASVALTAAGISTKKRSLTSLVLSWRTKGRKRGRQGKGLSSVPNGIWIVIHKSQTYILVPTHAGPTWTTRRILTNYVTSPLSFFFFFFLSLRICFFIPLQYHDDKPIIIVNKTDEF